MAGWETPAALLALSKDVSAVEAQAVGSATYRSSARSRTAGPAESGAVAQPPDRCHAAGVHHRAGRFHRHPPHGRRGAIDVGQRNNPDRDLLGQGLAVLRLVPEENSVDGLEEAQRLAVRLLAPPG